MTVIGRVLATFGVWMTVLVVGLVPWLSQRKPQDAFCLPYKNDVLVCQERTLRWAPLLFIAPPMWWVNR